MSVGKHFSAWLKRCHPKVSDNFETYKHLLPNGRDVDARQYPNEMWPLFADFIDEVWLKKYSVDYFKTRDLDALQYLPK